VTARGFIISAPRSGSGKTIVTLGLLAAFRRRGITVRTAKAGPDYIDTAFHAAATAAPGLNLDTWAMPPALLDALAGDAARDAELLVIEGAMGLYDGIPGTPGRSGSAADLAVHLGLPVILVLDVSGQSQTAAALVRGLAAHDPRLRIAGVVLNRVGSERHRLLVADAMAGLGVPVLGAIVRDETLKLPERHLGLVQAGEHDDLEERLERLAAMAEQCIDLDAVLAAAKSFGRLSTAPVVPLPPPGQRIALASDAAFSFCYSHVLQGWRRAGAEIVSFSPLADEPPSHDCDSCWLPGGYPELHAGKLAASKKFNAGLARFAETRPVHGECGGYMVLGEFLVDADGAPHAMAGLLGHTTSFAQRKLHLGYRVAKLLQAGAYGAADCAVRGHEFHYATLITAGNDAPLVELTDGEQRPLGKAGGRRGHVTGTFFHAIAAVR
jgi:cobyrinic acid a,c-diamide synthase